MIPTIQRALRRDLKCLIGGMPLAILRKVRDSAHEGFGSAVQVYTWPLHYHLRVRKHIAAPGTACYWRAVNTVRHELRYSIKLSGKPYP